MTTLFKEIELAPTEEESIRSEQAKYYVKLSKIIEEAEKEKERVYKNLDEAEIKEAFASLQKQHNIPEYVTVHDAAEIIGVTVQMVRRYCAEEKLTAQQTLPGSGKWLIETKQLMDRKNWGKFIQNRARIKENSLKLGKKMLEILDDDSE